MNWCQIAFLFCIFGELIMRAVIRGIIAAFAILYSGTAMADCGGWLQPPCRPISVDHSVNPSTAARNAAAYNPAGLDYGDGYGFFEFNAVLRQGNRVSTNVGAAFLSVVKRLFTTNKRTFLLTLEVKKVINGTDILIGKRIIAAVSLDEDGSVKYSNAFDMFGPLTTFIRLDVEPITLSMKIESTSEQAIDLRTVKSAASNLATLAGSQAAVGTGGILIQGYADALQKLSNDILSRFNTHDGLERTLTTRFLGDGVYGVRFLIFDTNSDIAINLDIKKKLKPSVLTSTVGGADSKTPVIARDSTNILSVARVGNGVSLLNYLRQPTDTDQGLYFKIGQEADGPAFAANCATLRELLSRTFARYDTQAIFWAVLNSRSSAIRGTPAKFELFRNSDCLDDTNWGYFETLKLGAPVLGFARRTS